MTPARAPAKESPRETAWKNRVEEMRAQGFAPVVCSVFRRGDMLLWVRAKS